VQNSLETELVALQRRYGFVEEFFGVLVAGVDARNINLFPFNWYIVSFEDSLDSFGNLSSDTVTYTAARQNGLKVLSLLSSLPGIRVTVYFPPYFVGLKISDSTVA
jgi:hypothetical protein